MGLVWVLGREAGGCPVDSLAQDRDRWRALVMNIRVLAPRSSLLPSPPPNPKNFWLLVGHAGILE
jgi:hypothetical protein